MMMLRWCYEGQDFIAQVLKDEKGDFYWRYATKGGGGSLTWTLSQTSSKTLAECIDGVMALMGIDELDSSTTPWVSRSGLPKSTSSQDVFCPQPERVFSPDVPKHPEKCDPQESGQK